MSQGLTFLKAVGMSCKALQAVMGKQYAAAYGM